SFRRCTSWALASSVAASCAHVGQDTARRSQTCCAETRRNREDGGGSFMRASVIPQPDKFWNCPLCFGTKPPQRPGCCFCANKPSHFFGLQRHLKSFDDWVQKTAQFDPPARRLILNPLQQIRNRICADLPDGVFHVVGVH